MKILRPDLPPEPELTLVTDQDLGPLLERVRDTEEDVLRVRVTGGFLEAADLSALTFKECLFENCRLIGCQLEKVSFIRCRFQSCDFSNSHMPDGYFHRCELTHCKWMGTDIYRGSVQEFLASDCNFQYANWDESAFKTVRLQNCDLQRAVLSSCRLRKTEFCECRMVGTNFFKTGLQGIDVTTCDLEGIVVSDDFTELRGLKVTQLQALELAKLLDIVIADEE